MKTHLTEPQPMVVKEAIVELEDGPAALRGCGGVALLLLVGDLASLMVGFAIVAQTPRWTACLVAIVGVMAARGHYRVGLAPSISKEAPGIVAAAAVPVVLLSVVQANADVGFAVVRAGFLATVAMLVGRAALYAVVRSERVRGVLLEPTLLVGAGKLGGDVARVLCEHPEYGLAPVGFVDDVAAEDVLPLPLLGPVSSLEAVIRRHGVRRVVLAFGPTADAKVVDMVRICDRAAVQLHVLPRFFELGSMTTTTEEVWGLPLVRLNRSLMHPLAGPAKRAFDLIVASAALVVVSPVMIAAGVLVRLSSPGPVLFRQHRVGQHGRIIEVLKFRSMLVNSESDTQWSVTSDDRVTSVGAFLRRTSLDELPQLINVVRGEMSLVGPRPERPFYVERFSRELAGYSHRHRAPAGMTGWAQVHGLRGDTSIEERIRFDNSYIENWSPWRDLVTLVRTIGQLRGEHRHDTVPSQASATQTVLAGMPTTASMGERAV